MAKLRIVVFASGTPTGGGSGFEKLVEATKNGVLDADIVAVISHYEHGGVREKADRLHIPFIYFPGTFTAGGYQNVVEGLDADYFALSGWVKLVKGLDPKITFNIHPGPLPEFGGKKMYGHNVHEAVLEAFKTLRFSYSAVSMHFVTEEYDKGPVFFHMPVEIFPGDTAGDIGSRVNAAEHRWQAKITNMVVHGEIWWDGKDPASLHVPQGYQFLPEAKELAESSEAKP